MNPINYKAGPYKRLEYFGPEDAAMFYGREDQAAELVGKILSAPITVLYAPSGAGKTSLLNARVAPDLESRGWTPIRATPGNDPREEIRVNSLHYVLPPPRAEAVAFERAVSSLGVAEGDSLEALLADYDSQSLELQRELIRPISYKEVAQSRLLPAVDRVTPYFCRMLGKTVEVEGFARHLRMLELDFEGNGQNFRIEPESTIREIRGKLKQLEKECAYSGLISRLYSSGLPLRSFFEDMIAVYGRKETESGFAIVLILDQFEELFTRFVDPGPIPAASRGELPNFQLKYDLFADLEDIFSGSAIDIEYRDLPAERSLRLPVRIVVSLRDEYLAKLKEERLFNNAFRTSSHHLTLLAPDEATAAIEKPANAFKYQYEPECLNSILNDLIKKDEQVVEPAHLQIVCSRLWEVRENGRKPGLINVELLLDEGGVAGILGSFFRQSLSNLKEFDRLEALMMLSPLLTSSNTRNLVEQADLTGVDFRDSTRRTRILEELKQQRLVRVIGRLGGYFVEITHEFLVGPIRQEIESEFRHNPAYSSLFLALNLLSRFKKAGIQAGNRSPLTLEDFRLLDDARDLVWWTSEVTELMFRGSIFHADCPSTYTLWAKCFEAGDGQVVTDILNSGPSASRRLALPLFELRRINSETRSLKHSSEMLETICRSYLLKASAADRDDVRYWSRRFCNGS